MCPPVGEGFTPCCKKPVFELPRTDRLVFDQARVTCGASVEDVLKSVTNLTTYLRDALDKAGSWYNENVGDTYDIPESQINELYRLADAADGAIEAILKDAALGRMLRAMPVGTEIARTHLLGWHGFAWNEADKQWCAVGNDVDEYSPEGAIAAATESAKRFAAQ